MRQLPNDKYTVAWFKLAEFVARGEKERALGLYRLLIHSFENKALAFQLEGDILLSFNDRSAAIESYIQAAEQYYFDKKFIESTAIYEHIILLQPHKQSFQKLMEYYEESANIERLSSIIGKFFDLLINQNELHELLQKVEYFEELLGFDQLKSIYQNMIVTLCKKKQLSIDTITPFLKKFFKENLSEKLDNSSQFLQNLKVLREDVYLWVCENIKND